MPDEKPYNPLDYDNLGESIARAILDRDAAPLRDLSRFDGAGIYALYYTGQIRPFAPYEPLALINRDGQFAKPIYVGKATNAATRTGIVVRGARTTALYERLNNHRASVERAHNLDLDDFYYRRLVLEDAFIGLGEAQLITTFQPLWNRYVWGFGSNAAGGGREQGKRSRWDTVHPGCPGAERLRDNDLSVDQIIDIIRQSLTNAPGDTSIAETLREATSDEEQDSSSS